jgi:hypothetical protein
VEAAKNTKSATALNAQVVDLFQQNNLNLNILLKKVQMCIKNLGKNRSVHKST